MRVDKWLWAIRVFKTRSIATENCKKGRVTIDDLPVKASRILKLDDIVKVKKDLITYTFQVKGLIGKRVSAKEAVKNYTDLTPKEETDKLQIKKETVFYSRDKGTGRPTKKDRRLLDKIKQ